MAEGKLENVQNSRPVPDPTVLTTQALNQAVLSIKELFDYRLAALTQEVERVHVFADQRNDVIKDQVATLEKLFEEKLKRITIQIEERDVQADKAARDVKSAVDAAFAAAKEAVGEQNKSNALSITKSETSTLKQIDAIIELLRNTVKTTDDKISDLKDRIIAIESHSKGLGDSWGYLVGAVGVMLAVGSIVGLIVKLIHN